MPPESPPTPPPSGHPAAGRLESWKEIAAYLKRDVRTVQRWEKQERLPVYRHGHGKLSTVYAYQSEIEAWLNSQQPPGILHLLAARRWLVAAVTVAVGAAGYLWLHARPAPGDIVTRRIWIGPDTHWLGTISADGAYLAYVNPDSRELMIREMIGGAGRRLTSRPPLARWGEAASPVISRDSRLVAYAWLNQDLLYELRLTGIKGGGQRVLYSNPAWPFIRPMDWSPDGAHILALLRTLDGATQIVLVNSDDGALHVLKSLDAGVPLNARFSPDGHWVAYDYPPRTDTGNRDLYLLDVAGPPNTSRSIPLVEHYGNDELLGWPPAGRLVLFASDRTGSADAWIIRVKQERAQGAPELVKKDLGMVRPLGFTRDGSFYFARQTPRADVYLVSINARTGQISAPVLLATHTPVGSTSAPAWSAGGRYIAYLSHMTGTIVVHSFEPPEDREVHPALGSLERIRWSADGHWLLASGMGRQGRPGLFRLDAATGQAEILWQGDLRRAVGDFVPASRGLIYKEQDWDLELGRLRGAGSPSEPADQFALSADGQRLAYSTVEGSRQVLKVAPLGGAPPRDLWRGPLQPGRIVSLAWTPDGSQVWFARNGELWRIAAAGGRPEKLALRMPGLTELCISPDGTRLAFTAGQGSGEVWQMQHFLPR
jgi:Tol biopolymer transport system component